MKRTVFYKIFLFLTAVGIIPLTLAIVLEYKNIQDLSQSVSSLSGVSEQVIEKVNLLLADTGILIFLISFFALILIILESVLLSRKITSPLYKLTEAAEKIRKGNFNIRVDIDSGDEFEELGIAFNKMVKDLKESNRALTRALDVSRKSKNTAEKEKNRTKTILNSLTEGLIVLGESKKIVFINPRAEYILGISQKKVRGKKIENLLKFDKVNKLYNAMGRKIGYQKEMKELFLDKPLRRIYEIDVIPLKGKKQSKENFIISLHDITREKRIERLKNEFISIAAHQLRTPLSAIKWSLEFLEEEIKEELGDDYEGEIEEYLVKTMESNERMINLVNDLLNVSRIEEGRFVYDQEKISLLKMVEKSKNYVQLEVEDKGMGINKKDQEKLFTKFSRGENAMKSETEGSGLGLFIVKNIIESHKGKVWFQSEPEKGSTFFFRIPTASSRD